MKLVLDANVLVAAFISHGACHELLEHVALTHQIVLSQPLLDEFRNVLVRKFHFHPNTALSAVRLLKEKVVITTPIELEERVCRDADDDVVLATAIAGKCDCIVTGDKDLTDLQEFRGIKIIRPKDFWSLEYNLEQR